MYKYVLKACLVDLNWGKKAKRGSGIKKIIKKDGL
jgi:hypothetical protein